MKIKRMMYRRMTGIIVCVALLLGICWYPIKASATEETTTVKENIYDCATFDIEDFRGEKPSAPEMDGYVFAGWYVKNKWASADETDEEVIYKPLRADAANAAKKEDEVYAKFVDEAVLGFKFQLSRGVNILSEKTNWRLITSVESLRYDSVGFRIQLGDKVQERDTYKVYKTIQGYVNENETSYTPQEQFAPKSSHFMVMTITNIPDLDFATDITVTPKWTTLDGTTVYGEPRNFTFEGVLTESVGENLQLGKGTDFEGFLTHVPTNVFEYSYYHDNADTGEVKIVYDKTNAYAKLRPTADGKSAKLTKACGTNILKAGTYRLSFKVKKGSAVDKETMRYGIYDGAYIVGMNDIDITKANATDWTTVTSEFTLNRDSSSEFANLDIQYICSTASEDNYVLIDDIEILGTVTNIDANNNGDFESVDFSSGTTVVLAQDETFWNTYKYLHNLSLEPNSTVSLEDDGANAYAKLLPTSMGLNVSLTKSCNSALLNKGTYKISFDVKKGSSADGTVSFGIFNGAEWIVKKSENTIDISDANATDWTNVTGTFTFDTAQTGQNYANVDIMYTGKTASADNYILIDNIEIIDATKYTNINIGSNSNFEATDFGSTAKYELQKGWLNHYLHSTTKEPYSEVYIMDNGDNGYAKLLTFQKVDSALLNTNESDGSKATITKQCSLGILNPGTYTLKLKVKKGVGADGALTFGIHDNAAVKWTEWAVAIDMSNVDTENWTEVTTSFTVASNTTSGDSTTSGDGTATVSTTAEYANLDITYTCGANPSTNNYVLIDDIRILDSANNSVDTIAYGDFEGWLTTDPNNLLTTVGWRTDNTGQDVVYATENYYENGLLVENNGNKCFKFYNSTGKSTTSDFAGNTAIAKAGVYKMVIKAKVGAGAIMTVDEKAASVITNIGFRFYVTGKASLLGTEQTTGTDGEVTTVSKSKQINSVGYKRLQTDKWVTLIAYFKVPETYNTNYCNINFYVFGNNDTVQKADNYLLIDDVEIYPVTPIQQ